MIVDKELKERFEEIERRIWDLELETKMKVARKEGTDYLIKQAELKGRQDREKEIIEIIENFYVQTMKEKDLLVQEWFSSEVVSGEDLEKLKSKIKENSQ